MNTIFNSCKDFIAKEFPEVALAAQYKEDIKAWEKEYCAKKKKELAKKSPSEQVIAQKYMPHTTTFPGVLSVAIMRIDAKNVAEVLASVKTTKHAAERDNRIEHLDENEKIIAQFDVDKGHRKGNEKHYITDAAHDIVVNRHSNRLVTILNSRLEQLDRFFRPCKLQIPEEVRAIARENETTGRNNDIYQEEQER